MNLNEDSSMYGHRGRRSHSGAGGGVVLIALALTQGLINFNLRSILPDFNMESIWPGFNWGIAWPIFLLIPGLLVLATAALSGDPEERADKLRSGTVLVALSVFFFFASSGIISAALWPVLFVLAGGYILLTSRAGHGVA